VCPGFESARCLDCKGSKWVKWAVFFKRRSLHDCCSMRTLYSLSLRPRTTILDHARNALQKRGLSLSPWSVVILLKQFYRQAEAIRFLRPVVLSLQAKQRSAPPPKSHGPAPRRPRPSAELHPALRVTPSPASYTQPCELHPALRVTPSPAARARVRLLRRGSRLHRLFWWRGLIHSKGARTAAASTPIGPRARL
jgi:hypothetical protein